MQGPISSLQWLSGLSAKGFFLDLGPFFYFRYLGALAALSAFCHPPGGKKWWIRRIKLIGSSAFRHKAVRSWLQAVGSCALMQRVALARPALLERPYRPLGAYGLRFRERMRIVLEHYRILNTLVPLALNERIYLGGGLECSVGEGRYALHLADSGPNPKEGELAFYWRDTATGVCLSQLSFYLVQGNTGPEIFVGGLQGPMGENSRDLIREATKACEGLRPKDVVMEALLAFAAALDVQRIVGVCRNNHVGRQRHTPREIHCDYEGFWMESGGEPLACGNVAMPVCQPRRDVMELPSKKRSAYRRKLAQVESIQAMVRDWLATPGPVPAMTPAPVLTQVIAPAGPEALAA
ncbi:hypothetical protein CF70_015690 [Cupriavidus sp. SK-3]|uniref:DUF535 family protein n=1 Tax=Cupriavidus sp. SK-3 TaxID=1470558 RepID=UPI000446B192|nr:DUF535 family protein [Cupriavidus sp. SK-3]KDP85130.1 hypothetical protein CF70_015690 [Cupriavidus sp. SK-3]